MMKTYEGSCHCGNVHFKFDHEEIKSGLRCNCSLCIRRGALMSDFVIAPDALQITLKEEDSLGLYEFDNKSAHHFFCKKCGIYPFHQTFRVPDHYRVNLVLQQVYIDGYRAIQSIQNKAQAAGNGYSLGKACNAVLDALVCSLRATHKAVIHVVMLLMKGATIHCKARLVANRFMNRCIHQYKLVGVLTCIESIDVYALETSLFDGKAL